MYPGKDFDSLDDTEITELTFEFVNDLQAGEVISTATWDCSIVAGIDPALDPTPEARLIGSPTIADATGPLGVIPRALTTQQVGNLVAGVKYLVQATVVTSLSNRYVLWSHIAGVEPS